VRLAAGISVLLAVTTAGRAAILRVPEDRATIGAALADARNGDVVSIAPGTYSARTGESFPLVLAGRAVIVEGGSGDCTLDGEGTSRVLVFERGDASLVRGLRIVGGFTDGAGGSVLIEGASPEIAHVRFEHNRADGGGDAVAVRGGAPSVRNCLFTGNDGAGSTIEIESGEPVIEQCTFHANGGVAFGLGPAASPTIRATVVSRPGRGRGPSVGLRLSPGRGSEGWPTLERNLFVECRDGVYSLEVPPSGVLLEALEEARRNDGLREGEPLDRELRPRGGTVAEIGAFAGADPLPDRADPADEAVEAEEPVRLLGPSVPNPFHPSTTIHFQVPEPTVVDLGVYNVLGQRVRTLLAGDLPAGESTATWDGRDDLGVDAPPGIYFVRITQGRRPPESRRLVLVR